MAQMVQNFALAALKLHPRNEEFFSNAEGEDFKRLKESIAEQGILTPLRVSSDMVIVSGHQRYRAAKELGMAQIPVIVDEALLDEDEKLAQLIASNFGRMKNDPVKQGRWIKEYERLRGVKVGRPDKSGNNSRISQEDIAKELGVDLTTLRNLKRLDTLLPELQDIISEGRVNTTTGFKLIARLSAEEQRQLLEMLPEAQNFTSKQVKEYIDQIKGYEDQIGKLTARATKAEADAEAMKQEAAEAVRVNKESSDAEDYLNMKKKMEIAQEELRKEHEAHNALKKNVAEVNRKTSEELMQLRTKLQEAEAKTKKTPEVVEVEREVEVYPEDYDELKEKAEKYDQLVKKEINTSVVRSLNTPEEQQRQFELRFWDVVEGFLPEFAGFEQEMDKLCNMPTSKQRDLTETIKEIARIAEKMLCVLNNKGEEVA